MLDDDVRERLPVCPALLEPEGVTDVAVRRRAKPDVHRRGHLCRDRRTRRANARRKRFEIAFRLLGEGAERARGGIGHIVDAVGLERPRDRPRPGHAPHHIDAEPAENDMIDAIGMRQRQECGNARTHRIADDMRSRDAEMVEQPPAVFGHQRGTVIRQFVELLTVPVPAIVEGDDAVSGLAEKIDPARTAPVRLDV